MAVLPSIDEVVRDPEFQGLPLGERRKVMIQVDPDFAGLHPREQNQVLVGLKTKPFWQAAGTRALGDVRYNQWNQTGNNIGQGIDDAMNVAGNLLSGGKYFNPGKGQAIF